MNIPITKGHVVLSSGRHSNYYIDKDAITRNPVICEELLDDLAWALRWTTADVIVSPQSASIIGYGIARRMHLDFVAVADIPSVPKWFHSWKLRGHIDDSARAILVDDVWTTGMTLRSLKEFLTGDKVDVVKFGVVVNRSASVPDLACAVQDSLGDWPAKECPHCSVAQ